MPLTPPVCSTPVGSTSTSCLRKFTVHFRRPPTLKQKNNYPYRGEYGFDWLREEYIYPIDIVKVNNTGYDYILEKKTTLCQDPDSLRDEYKKHIKDPITPYGQDYYPAWLSIFANDVKGSANSTMHSDGVYLTLQLDEIDGIIDDGTEIILKPGKACLKVTPEKIAISKFIATGKKSRQLGDGGNIITYYELVNAVRIICYGDTLGSHEEIKVFAKLGDTEVEVGKLMVYENKEVLKANIVVVNVITSDSKGNKIYPDVNESFEYLLKYQSFNQALVRAEVSIGENFDITKLAEKSQDAKNFLININNPDFLADTQSHNNLKSYLMELYQNFGDNRPENGVMIDDPYEDQYNTYLLFTKLSPQGGDVLGVSSGDKVGNKFEWGNLVIIFEPGVRDNYTIPHEIGHSFSLTHLFDSMLFPSPYIFHKGYTDNYMDYIFHQVATNNYKYYIYGRRTLEFSVEKNPYRGKMHSFFKWQWDLIRKDRSMQH